MKNKVLYIFICFIMFVLTSYGQGSNAIFPDGTTVVFDNKVASALAEKSNSRVRVFNVLSAVGGANVVHRVFVDGENRTHFGYDLDVKKDAETGKFTLTFKPLSVILFSNVAPSKILPKFPEPMQVKEGDTISVDLLENPKTKEKIADFIKILQGAPNQKNNQFNNSGVVIIPDAKSVQTFTRVTVDSTDGPPKDFSLDEVILQMFNASLTVNGKLLAEKKVAFGANVYFYVKGKGRFVISPFPREGFKFQKTGMIDGRNISFEMNGDKYEIQSLAPIICSGGKWNLWVLHEPDYRPNSESEVEFGGGKMGNLAAIKAIN
jgi:hypothetical protein